MLTGSKVAARFLERRALVETSCRYIEALVKSKGLDFGKLRGMSKKELQELGLGLWNEKDGKALMLFPGNWYEQIPQGYEVETILGESKEFGPGIGKDRQFGMLPYGISVKVARRFLAGLRADGASSRCLESSGKVGA